MVKLELTLTEEEARHLFFAVCDYNIKCTGEYINNKCDYEVLRQTFALKSKLDFLGKVRK